MEFTWSGWIVGSLILYGMTLCVIAGFVQSVLYGLTRRGNSIYTWPKLIPASVIGLVLLVTAPTSLSWWVSSMSMDDGAKITHISDEDFVKERFGFESGKEYPLILGGQTTSFDMQAYSRSGFFSATTSVNIQGGTAFTIKYERDGKFWDVEVPRVTNTVIERSDVSPSVRLFLSNEYESVQKSYGFNAQYETPYVWTDCHTVVVNLFPVQRCTKQTLDPKPMTFNQNALDRGLAAWLAYRIDHSELVMPASWHNELIGKIG